MPASAARVAWRLQPGEPLQEGFTRLALEEVERARTLLDSAEKPDEAAVHQARRSFKKLRALVRLARPSLGASFRRENHRWRDAGRLLSASRDAAVLCGSLDRLAGKAGLSRKDAAELRRRVTRADGSAAPVHGTAEAVSEVLKALDKAAREIPRLHWPRGIDDLRRGLRDSQSRLKRSWKIAKREPQSEALHDWRKRVKDTASHLGLFRAVLPADLKESRNQTRALAELLGEEHDLALLCEKLSADTLPEPLRDRAAALLDTIGERRNELRGAALEKGEALSTRSAKALAEDVTSRWREAGSASRKSSGPQAERSPT